MKKTIRFYYDFISPYSYLAFNQLEALKKKTGALLDYQPIHILSVMKAAGNIPTTIHCVAKQRYVMEDLARWCALYNVPLKPNPHFRNIDTRPLLMGALAAASKGKLDLYNTSVFNALWIHKAAFASDEEITSLLETGGVGNAKEIWDLHKEFTSVLDDNNDRAVEEGVFGVPSFVCDGHLYFGNDRLAFLERALTA